MSKGHQRTPLLPSSTPGFSLPSSMSTTQILIPLRLGHSSSQASHCHHTVFLPLVKFCSGGPGLTCPAWPVPHSSQRHGSLCVVERQRWDPMFYMSPEQAQSAWPLPHTLASAMDLRSREETDEPEATLAAGVCSRLCS